MFAVLFIALSLITFSPRLTTGVYLSEQEYAYLTENADALDGDGTVQIVREDSKHWLGVTVDGDDFYLKIYNADTPFNCRAIVYPDTRKLMIIKGVDYEFYETVYDAMIVSMNAKEMVFGAMMGYDIFSTNKTADQVAEETVAFLSQFSYEDNNLNTFPAEALVKGTMDSDDYAFYAWMRLTEWGVDAKVVIIDSPEGYDNDLHAACVYQSDEGWKIIEMLPNGYSGIRDFIEDDWTNLPVLLYPESVYSVPAREADPTKWMVGEKDTGNTWLFSERQNVIIGPEIEIITNNQFVFVPEELQKIQGAEITQEIVFYEEAPYNSEGINTAIAVPEEALAYLSDYQSQLWEGGTIMIQRKDAKNWIGVSLIDSRFVLRINHSDLIYNCRAEVDMETGYLTVIHGVDYPQQDILEDVMMTADQAFVYLQAVMGGTQIFEIQVK